MNLLVTLDRNYLGPLSVMLHSVGESNREESFDVYVAHSSLLAEDLERLRRLLGPQFTLHDTRLDDTSLTGAPITYRYPAEMYYRIFAAQYLPASLDRILYLDPDLVVRGSLRELYDLPFDQNLFIAASHINTELLQRLNQLRLDMPKHSADYVNSGVMLLNLEALRREQQPQQVLDYIEEHRSALVFPDQDVLNGLYGDRTREVDPMIWNLGEKYYILYNLNMQNPYRSLEWIRENSVIIHYCGRQKPWKESYHGLLGEFYEQAYQALADDPRCTECDRFL